MRDIAPTAVERRRETREIADYLRSGLLEPNRDYSHQKGSRSFTCELGEVAHDDECEVLWGDPIGWRVVVRVDEDTQAISLRVYDRPGNLHAELTPYTNFNYGVGVGWLERNLP